MATVRDRGYARWGGTLLERRHPWWPITRTGVELTFRKKRFKFFFAVSFVPAMFFLVGIYASERLEDFKSMIHGEVPALFRVNPAFFKTYMSFDTMLFMLMMLLVFAGAGLVADDLKHNALQLYFARPLRKRDYVVGKGAVAAAFTLALTVVPALVLLVFKLVFAGSFAFLRQYPWLPFSILGYGALLTLFFAAYALLLSSLSRNSRYVSILIFTVYIFSDVAYGIFHGIFRSPWFALLSIKNNLQQAAAVLFGQRAPLPVPPALSFAVLGLIVLAAGGVLARRIRAAEAIR